MIEWYGRQMTLFGHSNGEVTTYTYNADGIRTGKQHSDANGGIIGTVKYTLDGTKIIAEDRNGSKIYYTYDDKGAIMGMIYGGVSYVFSKNLQGDVIGIYNESGDLVAKYEYNAFGEITSVTDINGSNIANINPFRYRGYYYDTETGLYYLITRYYDPVVGRFINADDVSAFVVEQGSLLQYNPFVYCLNDPISRADENGMWSWPKWAKKAVAAVAVVATVAVVAAVTVATAGTGTAVACAALGAAQGAAVGMATGAVTGAVEGYLSTGTLEGTLNGMADGALAGSISGAISGGVSGGITHASKVANGDPLKAALKQLDASGLRPGQTQISRSRVMELVDTFDSIKARSSIYSNGASRYIVDGHHTTVASTILGKGTCVNMGAVTNVPPSVTNVYWAKKWYEFGKTVIKIVD